MNSRRIMVVAAAAVALFGYLVFFEDRDDLILYLSIGLIILVVAYVFQHQIDHLMLRGVPMKLDDAMRNMLIHTSPHFRDMDEMRQKMVEDRMIRWVQKKEFLNMNEQDAPEDVKYILAYYAILLTIHQEKFDYDGIDRVVFYHHPFLTPRYPDEVHILELEKEDGSLIISVPHLLKGHLEKGYYNTALHLIADAYHHLYLKREPQWSEHIWSELESYSTISKEAIDAYIGLPVYDPWPVAVHHQLMYRDVQIPEVIIELPQFSTDSIILKSD